MTDPTDEEVQRVAKVIAGRFYDSSLDTIGSESRVEFVARCWDFYSADAEAIITAIRAMDREKTKARERHQAEVWGCKGGPM